MRIRFVVCKCKKHGRVLLDEDMQGPEMASKEQATRFLRSPAAIGMLGEKIAGKLAELVLLSALPMVLEDVDTQLLGAITRFNFRLKQSEADDRRNLFLCWSFIDPELIHDYIDTLISDDEFEVPHDIRDDLRGGPSPEYLQ